MGNTESTLSDKEGDQQQQALVDADSDSDSWWWEVENANLILDHMPNVTSVYNNDVVSDDGPTNNSDSSSENKTINNIPSGTLTKEDDSSMQKEQLDLSVVFEAPNKAENSARGRETTLEEFQEELRVKRLARKTAVQDLRDEIVNLRKQLAAEQMSTRHQSKSVDSNSFVSNSVSDATYNQDTVDNGGACAISSDNDYVETEMESTNQKGSRNLNRQAIVELADVQLQLQMANSDNITMRSELNALRKQVGTLKEVITCCKQMLAIKEDQCEQFKIKLKDIETSFAEREINIMSDNLRIEYERQLNNIKELRQLYDERQRVSAAEHENLQRLLSIKRDELLAEKEKTKDYAEHNQGLVKEMEKLNNESINLRQERNEYKLENHTLKEEMNTINTLFGQMIMGFSGIDIDRLAIMLEENRGLLNEMLTKEALCGDGATLPKLLFELFEQASVSSEAIGTEKGATTCDNQLISSMASSKMIGTENDLEMNKRENNQLNIKAEKQVLEKEADKKETILAHIRKNDAGTAAEINFLDNTNTIEDEINKTNQDTVAPIPTSNSVERKLTFEKSEIVGKVVSVEEIVNNLPKVWKVLMELLSHHTVMQVQLYNDANCSALGSDGDCYKSVQTANGSKAEISVSKTYIKLKNLILEKKSLVKETNRLKTLNSHLECRMNEQEKRLSVVSLELTKTWHLVGKMQRQHRQLHTQEQILRYQLQQKRRLLIELKEELEHCRRKWAAARVKNDESQTQCNDLRREFAKRKLEDANHHSAESGYSDGTSASDEDAPSGTKDTTGTNGIAAVLSCSRRQRCRELFEHTRHIKRMQSTSPGRAALSSELITPSPFLRGNSAPPTCGWWHHDPSTQCDISLKTATIIKKVDTATGERERNSRTRIRNELYDANNIENDEQDNSNEYEPTDETEPGEETEQRTLRATRIQRLEEQCKLLIQKVLETSGNREQLEMQLCQFQNDTNPTPLKDLISVERTARASSAPASTGVLTEREEEYTRKRSERLERLEEESRQLMSRIKRTTDRGHYLGCSVDRIRRAPSHEQSLEAATSESLKDEKNTTSSKEIATDIKDAEIVNTIDADEISASHGVSHDQVYDDGMPANTELKPTLEHRIECINRIYANRDERLQLLKEEGEELLKRLSHTSRRGTEMIDRINQREINRNARAITDLEKADVKTAYESPIKSPKTDCTNECQSDAVKTRRDYEQHGAIPKTTAAMSSRLTSIKKSSNVELSSVARSKLIKTASNSVNTKQNDNECKIETLEEMVTRLQSIPFPECKDDQESKID